MTCDLTWRLTCRFYYKSLLLLQCLSEVHGCFAKYFRLNLISVTA